MEKLMTRGWRNLVDIIVGIGSNFMSRFNGILELF